MVVSCTLYAFLVLFSPWIAIPYSDAMGLVFPLAVLNLYMWETPEGAGSVLKWLLIGFISWTGYKIKPQLLFALLAILAVGFLDLLQKRDLLKKARILALLAAGILPAMFLIRLALKPMTETLDESKTVGPAHFLMMGLNTETMGIYNQDDVDFSASFNNQKDRNKASLQVIGERIHEMGPKGLFLQMVRKTLSNYNDASWNWENEDRDIFYFEKMEPSTKILSSLLRKLYYSNEPGSFFTVFLNVSQMLWLVVLAASLVSVFAKGREKERSVIMLTLIGLSLFQVLFECRSRYFYSYVCFYVLLSVMGMKLLADTLAARKSARETEKA